MNKQVKRKMNEKANNEFKGGCLNWEDYSIDEYEIVNGVTYLKELTLWEVSLVTFPMNPLATVDSVKSTVEGIKLPEIHISNPFQGNPVKKEETAPPEEIKSISSKSAIKIIFYMMAADGKIYHVLGLEELIQSK